VIGIFVIEKSLSPLRIDIKTLRLKVWPVIATDFRALIPIKTEPLESIDCGLNVFIGDTSGVGIFDAK
jgi:hypothetical protein